MRFRRIPPIAFVLGLLFTAAVTPAADIPRGLTGFKSNIEPFFQAHCIDCHGPTRGKAEMTLHTLAGNFAGDLKLKQWELILEKLASGEMPPEDVPQPNEADRKAVVVWIEAELKDYFEQAKQAPVVPTARRLTNFEYQNTMRDLLGFELNLIDNLPEDPIKPYRFNNTSEYMLIGPEQMDRYHENARRAMASAIVDPGEPEVHRTSIEWNPRSTAARSGMLEDEIGVYQGAGPHEKAFQLKSWPQVGEYRIRIKAAGILPPGFQEVPLRLVMGTSLRGDAGTGTYVPVGTVHLTNDVDHIQEYDFRGRIENHPVQVGNVTAKGQEPSSLVVTAQNLFDNGELNDHRSSAFDSAWNLSVPRVVLRSIEFEAPVTDVWPPEHHTRILFESPLRQSNPDAYLKEVLRRFATRAFRRPATDVEVERFVKVFQLFEGQFDTFEEAIRETLAIVLVSPQFLYHTETTDPAANKQYTLASRLSYFLWGSMPDDALFQLAQDQKLNEPSIMKTQVLRMLADERSGQFVDNFTTQWLSLSKMKAVNINRDLFPRFLYHVHAGERSGQEQLFRPTIRDYMHEETVGFVAELIRRNASVSNIVDSDFAYLNQPLAAHYEVAGVQGLQLRPVAIQPEHKLGGLLTQGSVLIGNSTGSAPHPIYRAVWLREAILGDEVKPPPADVPALSDTAGDAAENATTIKDLLRLHRQKESCNDCHVRLDPWGIPFEHYNAIGKYQPLVPAAGTRVRGFRAQLDQDLNGYATYLQSINTLKVEADARVPHGPHIDGMQSLKDYLLKDRKEDIAENVLRRLLTYGLGRELTYRDRFVVEQLLQDAKQNDYKLQDMIIAICRSEVFHGLKASE